MNRDPNIFLEAVETHVATAIEHCRDRWGHDTGLLADGYSLSTRRRGAGRMRSSLI